jgi:hypothetical protein
VVPTPTAELLASLDPLSYSERMAGIARWARTTADRAPVYADLRAAGPYERSLALTAAVSAGDADEVLAALDDPQPALRATAIEAAVRHGWLTEPDPDLPAVHRRLVFRTLRAVHRPDVADALLPRIRERQGDTEAAALLPACGAGLVRRLLPELDHAVNLTAVARRHPQVLLDYAEARLEAVAPQDRPRIWRLVGHAVLRCDPVRVLDLLERYAPEDALPGGLARYGVLAACEPRRVLALLTAPRRASWVTGRSLPRPLLRRLVVLSDEELVPLGRRLGGYGTLAKLLRALPPRRRAAFFDRVLASLGKQDDGIRDQDVLALLPHAVRAREAARTLSQPWAGENEAAIRTWSVYLSWPQARAALQGALHSGDAEERAQGYQLLVKAARLSRDPDVVAEVITGLDRLRNEQDPVRSAALTALAGLAPLITAGTAAGLTRLTTAAVEARDVSAQSSTALAALAAAVLRHHFDVPELRNWALHTIDLTSTSIQVPALGRFDRTLRRRQETLVFDRLRGWVEAGMARGRYEPLFALTRALGGRARQVPQLQDLLRRAIHPDNVDSVVRTAIELWLRDPRSRAARLADIVDQDPSAVTIPVVWQTLCTRRTDLLDRVLADPPQGRFLQRGVRWAPPEPLRADRWLPRQHAAFTGLQERIAQDTGAPVHARAAAIRAAAPIPVLGRVVVLRWVDAPEVVLAEAALGALVWTDRPGEALPVLLRHAGDDRARVALYAAARAARFVAPSRLPALLDGVLLGAAKVTSRKEAARIVARLGPAESTAALLTAYRKEDQHRDVRAAIVAAARDRLWSAPSWTVLDAGVRGRREECLAVLAAKPDRIAERDRARYAALVVTACRSTDREIRRAAFGRLAGWAPWTTGITGLVADHLADLDETLERWDIEPLVEPVQAAGLIPLWQRLIELDEADDPGNATRDRPAYHRIDEVAQAVVTWSDRADRRVDRGPALAAARWLADRPLYLDAAVQMLVGLGRLTNLDEVADRVAHRPVLAAKAARYVHWQVSKRASELHDGALLVLATELGQHGDLARGLFAVQVAMRGYDHDWPPPWRDLLRWLRQHSDPDVAAEALSAGMSW